MYIRYDGKIINLDNISYIDVSHTQADFYCMNGLLLTSVPLTNKEDAINLIESAMSYSGLIQAIDRLKDSYDGLSESFTDCMKKFDDLIDNLGVQRLNYTSLMNDTMEQWADILGVKHKVALRKIGEKQEDDGQKS